MHTILNMDDSTGRLYIHPTFVLFSSWTLVLYISFVYHWTLVLHYGRLQWTLPLLAGRWYSYMCICAPYWAIVLTMLLFNHSRPLDVSTGRLYGIGRL